MSILEDLKTKYNSGAAPDLVLAKMIDVSIELKASIDALNAKITKLRARVKKLEDA